ncbi:N-acetyltransferase [Paracoccus sp. YLB-12]|uniref:N-acetyltransferase n=1 Tax=Paracoccus maritimus TaxID=2933292 RepID=A0ABT2K5G8_9RHOB|nr:GNAT family N-acetyltransferase [Paracoccus sp. YLB-12]MCT4331787.1 N-acetyltransferase [Paracoccus sp. YLB-12]
MTEITVTKEETGPRSGRYVARVAGIDSEAELTFTLRGEGLISADHTGAPDPLRGSGAAGALVRHMVQDARQKGFRIIPICPYVQAQYAKHPDWADAFTTAPGEKPKLRG